MRKELLAALDGRNHRHGLTGMYGQAVRKSLLSRGPSRVPSVPREIEIDGASAQWWSESSRPLAHWYVTEHGGLVEVTDARHA